MSCSPYRSWPRITAANKIDPEKQEWPAENPRSEWGWSRFLGAQKPGHHPGGNCQKHENVGREHHDPRVERKCIAKRKRRAKVYRDRGIDKDRAVRGDEAAQRDGDEGNQGEHDRLRSGGREQ